MIDSLFTIAIGVIAVLMSYGKISLSKDPAKNQEYLSKYGVFLRVCGIILIVTGAALTIFR